MHDTELPSSGSAERRTRIETLVGAYPDLAPPELDELLHWYRKEASALEVALLSARTDIRAGYARFFRDHVDRVSSRDLVRAALFLGLSGAFVWGFCVIALARL
ncbi:hypothetical protein SLG_29700 [Sphingobium sp. SYK-6]|uniref:hypothetical protein n=1 Tax=Sphingobium sp. (strain NBRC 103272 / SYK-6) TaxID=627192 RepID=UPI0002277306|nr:hypothetical protein [Sphingobium sp. SYK-6]BAK67645.1 hypothetical protein SLG_29700 [Sphingobium sp. SYK-6]